MNCDKCRRQMVALVEDLLDDALEGRLRAHLAECSTCLAEFQDLRQLTLQLACDGVIASPEGLETAVMDGILREQSLELRRLKMRRRWRMLGIGGAMAAAAAMFVIGGLWLAQPVAAEDAAEALMLGAAPVPEGTTVHIVAKMRTMPGDNFSFIDSNTDFVRVEVWKQLGEKEKWRVEKPDRVAVMNGESTVMLIRPETAVRLPHSTEAAFDTGQLLELATAHVMISREIQSASAHGGELKIKHETTASGERKLLVTVETKAGVPAAEYLKNKFLGTSDLRRVYRFDAKSGRLEGMDAYLHRDGGDVLVLSIESIEYVPHVDPAVFSLKLPDNVQYAKAPEPLPDNEKYGQMTPKQAARTFFEACSKGDWGEAQKFYPMPMTDRIKGYLDGLEIVRLGEPLQSAVSILNGDWFVPYEIKLKDGHVKKWNLALRKHRTAKRYLVDGGI